MFYPILNQHFNDVTVCCDDVMLSVSLNNVTILFDGHKLDDNSYWFGQRIFVSISEEMGIDNLYWNAATNKWVVGLILY